MVLLFVTQTLFYKLVIAFSWWYMLQKLFWAAVQWAAYWATYSGI